MTEQTESPAQQPLPESGHHRIAFERLRERTDELELLVSGLTVFALLSAPGYILSLWMRSHVHMDENVHVALGMVTQVGIGLCYALALIFLLHIVIRSYWIGLIGLKSAFPDGIRWDKAHSLGPLSREFYQRRLPDMDSVIDGADRLASMIFASANVVAISVAWFSVLFGVLLAVLGALVSFLGLPQRVIPWVIAILFIPQVLATTAAWFIDTWVLRRRPQLANKPGLRRAVNFMLKGNAIMPLRLIMPLQLTLQGNTHSRRVTLLVATLFFLIPFTGALTVLAQHRFTSVGSYTWLNDDDLDNGLRSAHYEDLRMPGDVGQPVPTIPSDRIAEAWLRLFLPHVPARDGAVLATTCAADGAEPAPSRSACAATLWQVRMGGRQFDPADFVTSERRDMGWRGFQVYLPMEGLLPGRHDLEVVWNPAGEESGVQRRRVYRIPFWLSPGYEQSTP